MKDINEIIDRSRPVGDIISDLQQKSTDPPAWSKMKKDYYAAKHKIVNDNMGRRDKVHSDGTVDKAARMRLPYEKIFIKQLTEFMVANPVKREYQNIDGNDTRMEIAKAIERIYEEADIDSVNMDRVNAFLASCEVLTIWYTVKQENDKYGFHSQYKLKCRIYSPFFGDCELYPLMDENDDMIAVSFKYHKTVEDTDTTFFETFTANKHFRWKCDKDGTWTDEIAYMDSEGNTIYGDDIILQKIPGIYAWKKTPTYEEGTVDLREDMEYGHSRDSDVVAYNASPILKVSGQLKGDEHKGESRRVYRVENNGDVSYVSWNGSTEATKEHLERDRKLIYSINQMADISFENLKGIGNVGYDARVMMFTDTILRVKMESKPILQMLRREGNVIKAFLKQMNTSWANEIDNVWIKHSIDIYIPEDESLEIDKRLKANGGKPIESQLESIQRYGRSKDPQATLDAIQAESENSLGNTINKVLHSDQTE